MTACKKCKKSFDFMMKSQKGVLNRYMQMILHVDARMRAYETKKSKYGKCRCHQWNLEQLRILRNKVPQKIKDQNPTLFCGERK